MAQNKNQTRATYYEVVFRGKPKAVRAFLWGLVLGSGHDASIFFNYEVGVHDGGKAERLAEKVGLRHSDVHVIVDGTTSALLKKLIRKIALGADLAIDSHRKIRSSQMEFSFQAYARKYDEEITGLLDKLPKSLKLSGYKHNVVVDPKAKGVEAYTVAHDYEAKGSGTISGPIDTLIAYRQVLEEHPLVESGEIRLKFA